MDPREAKIYGQLALEILSEAKQVLCKKYAVEPSAPIMVEIFPDQSDFAIRTFGLPGGQGFLGVCFGRVITANSPASQGDHPANWQSVLWHEFCHVVTLEKTKNRMPRWLSEGISVYEERQRDPAWGESITPTYREMLLDQSLTPVSDLSAAFLNPPSPIHLQFAYYHASLVVEFLIDRYGHETLLQILSDLGDGLPIRDALARGVGSLAKLDQQFARHARQIAESFAPSADWSREGVPQQASTNELADFVEQNPKNYWALRALAEKHFANGDWAQAREPLENLVKLDAVTGASGGPLEMLAEVYRRLGDDEKELSMHRDRVRRSSDAISSLRRLTEISVERSDWQAVANHAAAMMAINPLLPEVHEHMSRAAEKLAQPGTALRSLRVLSMMDPVDPAALDFRLARSLHRLGKFTEAKHRVLRALDEAPRYRDAHRLLLKIHAERQRERLERTSSSFPSHRREANSGREESGEGPNRSGEVTSERSRSAAEGRGGQAAGTDAPGDRRNIETPSRTADGAPEETSS
jgi:tetratricopeptide (TPR) repeat protein